MERSVDFLRIHEFCCCCDKILINVLSEARFSLQALGDSQSLHVGCEALNSNSFRLEASYVVSYLKGMVDSFGGWLRPHEVS